MLMKIRESLKKNIEVSSEQTREFFAKYGKTIAKWSIVYVLVALGSLFVTDSYTVLVLDDYPVVLLKIVPRVVTLFLFTCFMLKTSRPKSGFLFMTAFWIVWLGISYSYVKYGILVGVLFLLAGSIFLLAEKPLVRDPGTVKIITTISLYCVYTLLLDMMVEFLSKMDILGPFETLLSDPDILGVNFLLISAMGAWIFWFPKPKMAIGLHSFFWLVLGFVNFLKARSVFEPIVLLDVYSIPDAIVAALDIFEIWEFIVIALLVVLLIGMIVFFISKEKNRKFKFNSFISASAYFLAVFIVLEGVGNVPAFRISTTSLRYEYDSKGFAYGLIRSSLHSFITQPANYSDATVNEIAEELREKYEPYANPTEPHNVIVVQLESFSDPYLYPGSSYEYDPISYIRSLYNNNTSGTVRVPVFGGQTVKSEFEFLTGLNIGYLPPGYSPYVQTINDVPVDNLTRYFSSLGYATTAIHNYQAEFFLRHDVYRNLGFDRYIPYEFMSGVIKREGSIWADDDILIEQIDLALDSNGDEKNFIFTVTVQTHGSYKPIDKEDYPMELYGFEDEYMEGRYAYYVGQLLEVDQTVKSLIDYLTERDEPTYVLFYSDHLPTLLADVDMTVEERYSTMFFTWNNMGITEKRPDTTMELYELSSYLMDILNMDGTFMNKFHNTFKGTAKYEEYFRIMQYYKIYEEHEDVDFTNESYELGIVDFDIHSIERNPDGDYVITGSGFTDDTYLCINGKIYNLKYVDANTLIMSSEDRVFENENVITLRIIGEKYGEVLKETEPYEYVEKAKALKEK